MNTTEQDRWLPIKDWHKDGAEYIVGYDMASVWIVRAAAWCSGESWEVNGFDNQEDEQGWWSYDNSVGQSKLEDTHEPTHVLIKTPPPPKDIS